MSALAKGMTPTAWPRSTAELVASIAWERVSQDLEAQGSALVGRLLSVDECQAISSLYQKDDIFRSHVVMERHGFGRGEYKYFNYPLPGLIASLSGEAFGLHRAMPSSRPEQTDTAPAPVRNRRLQLSAPGPLWRACFPTPARDLVV